MSHDVFISYSNKDKTVADAVCATLESHRVRCWIAPRDVPPGQTFARSLINAISASRVLVLILSEDANRSVHVLREVGEAVDHGIPIIPLRIEDVQPSEEMRYYIKSIHWLDAMTPPMERHLKKLASSVQALLGVAEEDEDPYSASGPVEMGRRKAGLPKWAIGSLGIIIVAMLVGIGLLVLPSLQQGDGSVAERESTHEDKTGVDWTEPRSLSFASFDMNVWEIEENNQYYAIGQRSVDAFAWSRETIEGDMILSLDMVGKHAQSEGCVILYGGGVSFSQGSLIFCVESEYYQLEKDTRYHEGDNYLAFTPSGIALNDGVFNIQIEILDDVASMKVNGDKVISTFFDKDEVRLTGRIGLLKMYTSPGVTFSNIMVQTRE